MQALRLPRNCFNIVTSLHNFNFNHFKKIYNYVIFCLFFILLINITNNYENISFSNFSLLIGVFTEHFRLISSLYNTIINNIRITMSFEVTYIQCYISYYFFSSILIWLYLTILFSSSATEYTDISNITYPSYPATVPTQRRKLPQARPSSRCSNIADYVMNTNDVTISHRGASLPATPPCGTPTRNRR